MLAGGVGDDIGHGLAGDGRRVEGDAVALGVPRGGGQCELNAPEPVIAVVRAGRLEGAEAERDFGRNVLAGIDDLALGTTAQTEEINEILGLKVAGCSTVSLTFVKLLKLPKVI